MERACKVVLAFSGLVDRESDKDLIFYLDMLKLTNLPRNINEPYLQWALEKDGLIDMDAFFKLKNCYEPLITNFGYRNEADSCTSPSTHFELLSHLYPLQTPFQHAITDPFFRTITAGNPSHDIGEFSTTKHIYSWMEACELEFVRFSTMKRFLQQLLWGEETVRTQLFTTFLNVTPRDPHDESKVYSFFRFYYVQMLLIAFKFENVDQWRRWVKNNTLT